MTPRARRRDQTFVPLLLASLLVSGAMANLPPSFTADMNLHVVSESTPVGAAIYTLKGSDPEGGPVAFGLSGTDRLRVDPTSGVVTIVRPLDREKNDTLRLVVTVEDEVSGANNNVVRVPVSLIVLDDNDNPPKFLQTPYETMVGEDSAVGSTVLPGIRLVDEDQVGDNIQVECAPIEQGDDVCDVFNIKINQASARKFSGSLVLRRPLEYASHSLYQFKLIATDGGQMSSVGVVVRVRDVQNTPPVFSGSLTGIVKEDDPIGTKIMTLHAADGDVGAPRPVKYQLMTNTLDFFTLDPKSGELRTAKPLDRDALQVPDGVVKLKVKAYETERGLAVGSADTETEVEVTITIIDVNDEPPTFNKREYRASVPENVPDGTPLPNLDMFVQDRDVGFFSVFSLRLVDSSGIFSVEPQVASGSSSVSIRVAKGPLDFENPNQRKFLLQVIAEETLTNPRLSSTATVVVSVTDTNDNPPKFDQEAYTALVSETANPGTVVTTIAATDRDTGMFGTDGIKYSLFGNGAEKFDVDATTGVITVAFCDTPGHGNCLDYEERPTYFLSYQAVDNGGEGHTTVVPVRISLEDSNDNPPKFSRQQFRAVIDEGASDFDPPLTVMAEDPDATSSVVYSLVGGDPTGLFTIDPNTGRVRVANESGLDMSDLKTDHIILTVEASDGTGSHTANVRVSVRDANNNIPIFSKKEYVAAVQENSATGSVVEQVSASDADTGENAVISYRIQRGGYDDFAIDHETGVITVARKLDFDRRQSYDIEILATDGGLPQQTSTASLTVSVIDNNDKNPYFTPTTQRSQVSEDVEPGTTFYTLAAQDPDVAGEGALVFGAEPPVSAVNSDGRLVEGPQLEELAEVFVVDPATGNVTVTKSLDRTVATEVTLAVTVTDVSATPPQVGRGNLVITIVDVNDFPPMFPPPWSPENPVLLVKVAEELPLGSLLTTITASDVDSNIGGYSLSEPSEHFSLDNATGVITVKARLDYETQPELNFVVVAHDTGVPLLSASTTIVVQLDNINDEEPVFGSPIYDAEVLENSPAGTPIINVTAVDADKGMFGVVTYSLAGDHHEYFAIDANGQVTVQNGALLDREALASVVLRVVATDKAPENNRHQSSIPLHITIVDTNDHAPVFSQVSYSASVVENLPLDPPAPIMQVTAHDKDEGLNALVRYDITEGNEQGAFYLDPETGILYPARPLLANPTNYNLTIVARDVNGTGEYSDETTVQITVLPQNQHKPKFTSPALPNTTVKVEENYSSAVQEVITVSAEDKDTGANGEIRYHLLIGEQVLQDTAEFHLNPTTGLLTTKRVLDREEQNKYELVLMAKDQGSPISYETLRFLTVVVEDQNDNRPMFPVDNMSQSYRFSIPENTAKHTLIGQLEAHDPDDGLNAKIFYYLVSGNSHENFYLDKLHGKVYTNAVLDREQRESYTLVVKATNDPNFIIDPEQEVVFDSEDPTQAVVSISVEDENDTPPRFLQDLYYAGVSHKAEVDRFVRMLKAVDDDAGLNGTLSYSIRASNLFRPGDTKAIGSIIPSPFNISQDGKLTTASLMSQYRRHRFLLQLQAKEEAPPHRTANCNVNVWVWERNDLARVVLAQPPEEVVKQQEEIAAVLSKVAEGTAVVDEIRYHVNPDNTVNRERTDMLVHLVNQTDQVMPVPLVLQRLDQGYSTLINNTHTAFIKNIYPATVDEVEEEVDARLAGLIALMIVLFVGFISFLVVCCCLRYWVMTPSGRSTEHLIKRNIDEDLGLNTTENPLWVDQKLKMYEEQELTMQVMSEFDASQVSVPPNAAQGPSVTVDAEWTPERRTSIDLSQIDAQSNTYATIQKSHGGTLRSLQLRSLQRGTLTLGEDPGESNDYATLDHLHRPASAQGPRVPGIETPRSPLHQNGDYHELRTSFTGSTFQPPDLANRPLPDEPSSTLPNTGSRNLAYNAQGEPVLVAELI
ncbi:cadherin-87A-like [Eriocheir sinensis]|uniref:cadherin-87A-like n=1 Tax=Eriocheir sinensis TaxID=95602 RepID=UPI0021C72E6B|nr:cadherin-87A-like [Eriocheir sinensis]XP_050727024.1 cadherin-87A-like [Eriocheir sinensis]XP_050727025.1 cadherin-87A-like [Eriocheir sinensis]